MLPHLIQINREFLTALAGSVKDSVVGEERIAQYLLAVLNSRSTPLHWRHLNNRRIEELRNEYDENKHDYNVKDLLPNRRKLPDRSDVKYIQVIDYHVFKVFMITCLSADGDSFSISKLVARHIVESVT